MPATGVPHAVPVARHELWVELADRPGNLAAVAADLAACGANIVHLDVHTGGPATVIDRLVVQVPDDRSPELAAAAARCGGTLLHADDADPHALIDDVVRALDLAALLVAADRPEALADALGRLVPADEVRVERRASSLERGEPAVERAPAPDGGWLLAVPHQIAGAPAVAVLRRSGPRFTATEAARCQAALRLADHLAGLSASSPPVPSPAAPRRAPTALERLVALADGGLVRLRHLDPDDDGPGDVVLAAEVSGRIVGVARYARNAAGPDAEVTVTVEDGHRHRGIGTLLVRELAGLAAHDDDRRRLEGVLASLTAT